MCALNFPRRRASRGWPLPDRWLTYPTSNSRQSSCWAGRRAGRPHLSDRCAGSHPAPDYYQHSLSPNYHLGRAPSPRAGFNAFIVREAVRRFGIMLISACSWRLRLMARRCSLRVRHPMRPSFERFFLASVISMRRPRRTVFSGCVLDGLDAEQTPGPPPIGASKVA